MLQVITEQYKFYLERLTDINLQIYHRVSNIEMHTIQYLSWTEVARNENFIRQGYFTKFALFEIL